MNRWAPHSVCSGLVELPEHRDVLKREFLSWLNRNQRAVEAPIVRALDAVYDIATGAYDSVGPAQLEALKLGLELPYLVSYPLAGYVLELAAEHEELGALVLQLAKHPLAKVRRNAMTICLHDGPEDMIRTMLLGGLQDRSRPVRLKAADVIFRTRRLGLTEHVRLAAEREPQPEAARELLWMARLMENGWVRGLDGRVTAYVAGGVAGVLTEPGDTDADIERKVAAERARFEQG